MENSTPVAVEQAPVSQELPQQSEQADVEQAEDAVAQASTPSEKKAAEKQLKKLQYKANGRTYNDEFDPNDDDYMSKQFSKAKAFDTTAAEKAQLEKEVRNFVEELRKNPRKVLSDPNIGLDLKQLAASIIEEEIENSKKSPEQVAKEKLEAELKEMKEKYEKEKEETRHKDFERLQQQEYERYDMLMTSALEKTDLPKSPYIVKKMADYMLLGLQEGVDVTPEDVIPLVREEIQNDLKEMFQIMPDELVEKLIGKDKLSSIRKKNLAKAKATPPSLNNIAPDTGKTVKSEEKPVKKMTYRDFFGA